MNRVEKRWEQGIPHDPRSVSVYERLAKLDFDNNDRFDFRSGGDGDNGEELMFLLDLMFEDEDKARKHVP